MATWAEQGPNERQLRVSSGRRFGRMNGEIESHPLPVGNVERAEILLESTFLHKPFVSYGAWKKLMEAHGFIVYFNSETIERNTERLRWQVDVQVYVTEKVGQDVERVFIRTLRLESTDPLVAEEWKRGNPRRRENR